ncbi:MAG: hypothetical protein RR951_10455 [Ruthenibacterium sp.]
MTESVSILRGAVRSYKNNDELKEEKDFVARQPLGGLGRMVQLRCKIKAEKSTQNSAV